MNNPNLTEAQKGDLIANSWRVNYRDKPPTPSNFISEKYLGPSALHTWPRIKRVFEEFMDPSKPYRNLILYPHISWGKEIRIDSKIYTPKGPIIAKDVQLGDEVCAPDGTVTKITGVFPQGVKRLFRLTFSDGRSVDAGLEHQWKAASTWKSSYNYNFDESTGKRVKTKIVGREGMEPCWKTVNTEDFLRDPKKRWIIPIADPVYHEEVVHSISPYTLGAFLGDGCGTESNWSSVNLVGDDEDIFKRVVAESSSSIKYQEQKKERTTAYIITWSKGSEFHGELERLGLRGKYAHEKHIPTEYLYDSIENRIALLQGLMDTDGYVNKDGTCCFDTTSPSLRDDFSELVRGLGGFASCWQDDRYLKEGSTAKRPGYRITFSFPSNSFPVFGVQRKQERVDANFTRKRTKKGTQYLSLRNIEEVDSAEAICFQVEHPDHLFITNDYIVTHNSYLSTLLNIYIGVHLSLMRNPYKYFGLNPASVLTQLLISYSLKKSSELLLEPMVAILESSPFFEKVHTREGMIKRDQDFERQGHIDKIFWTTAVPTSAIQFSGGANFKLASSPHSLLGLTVVQATLSELAFFREAGKALALDELIITDRGIRTMAEVQVGDKVLSPSGDYTEVVAIPWEGVDDLYEIEMEDGRIVRCNAKHLWPVTYRKNGQTVHEVVETQFMIDHPEIEFDIQEVYYANYSMAIVKSIKKIGQAPQKCIRVANSDGLFVLSNKLVTHNSDDYIMRLFNDAKSRVDSRMKGNYFGRTVLDSSPNTLDSPIDEYIINHAKSDPINYIVQGSMWKWSPEDYDMSKTFFVYVGGKGQPPRILETEEEKQQLPPTKLIEVPMSQLQFFKDDIYKSLKDRAGIPAGSADQLVYDYTKIEGIFHPKIRNVYSHIYASSEEPSANLIWDQIDPIFFKTRAGRKEFWYKPHIPRFVSVDLSISGDVTGIAMTHAERIADSDNQMFVSDFNFAIAPGKGRVNIDAVKFFIQDLRDKGNLNIACVSFDQFQSEAVIQYLKLAGFNVEKVSVDSTVDPYMFMLSLLDTKHLMLGRNLYVKNNLKSLKLVKTRSGKQKVDHGDERPVITTGSELWETSLIGTYAKDCTDALAASIELCRRYYPVAHDFWDITYFDRLDDVSAERKSAQEKLSALLGSKGLSLQI
jgi:hypothetical protein